MATLILNTVGEPLDIIGWKKAISLCLEEKVFIVKEGSMVIRSVGKQIVVPEIICFKKYVNPKRFCNYQHPNKQYFFLRDNFQCQYCGKTFTTKELTLDHVIPKSRGGSRSHENIVSSCKKCNNYKGCKTPKEAKMKLIKPIKKFLKYTPTRYKILIHYPQWIEYIKKST